MTTPSPSHGLLPSPRVVVAALLYCILLAGVTAAWCTKVVQ